MSSERDEVEQPGGGFLKQKQWEYLVFGEEDLSNTQVRQHRYNIRKNLQNTLIDFESLPILPDRDLLMALAPLAGYFGIRGVTEDPKMANSALQQWNIDQRHFEDPEKGARMFSGLTDFLGLFRYLLGPRIYAQLVGTGLKIGSAQYTHLTGEDTGEVEVTIEITQDGETLAEVTQ